VSTSDTSGKQALIVDPEAQLMLQVKGGDESAFEELVERYQNRVLSVFYNALGDREEAQDLTQDLFLRIYRARHGYRPSAKFSTWVFTIVSNLALNARRSRRKRRTVGLETRDSGPLGARPQEQLVEQPGVDAAGAVERHELADLVRLAISQLNERQRMAVLLNKFEDLGYAEIAQVMGLTPAAVKSLLSRARTNLRELLEPYLRVS
jgi:RNA polymerase sigma-70 factor (ECF subfamily)